MKMGMMKKVLSTAFATVLVMGLFTGCGNASANSSTAQAKESSLPVKTTATVFTKGVYVNYAAEAENPELNYFYVFYGDGTGSIEDGVAGTANYFEYETGEDTIDFHIGSIDPINDTFTVTSYENGIVKGHFEDGLELVFEPLTGADIETFNAVNYVNGIVGEPSVYTDANGWSVKYDASLITVNQGGPITTFVYTGDCAGTNMITVTYTVENKAEAAVKELGKSWGDIATYTDGVFPGTEDVKGYWVTAVPTEDGTGSYMTAVARDYMEGALVFELTGTNGEDEANNLEVSGVLSDILNSIEFAN